MRRALLGAGASRPRGGRLRRATAAAKPRRDHGRPCCADTVSTCARGSYRRKSRSTTTLTSRGGGPGLRANANSYVGPYRGTVFAHSRGNVDRSNVSLTLYAIVAAPAAA